MCIFTEEVDSVSKTKILVSVLDRQTQLTVYSNEVSIRTPTAMVLPFPNPGGTDSGIKMIDTRNCTDLFDKLKQAFPANMMKGARGELFFSQNSTNSWGDSKLEVHECGSYRYSIAYTFADLTRLRTDVFKLHGHVAEVLNRYYNTGFGFLICILKESGSYSPIAYTHPMVGGKMFIPTRHEHGHGEEDTADWDHDIYVNGTVMTKPPIRAYTVRESVSTLSDIIKKNSYNSLEMIPSGIDSKYFQLWKISGDQKNKDLQVLTIFAFNGSTCSFEMTGSEYALQPWFNCIDCGLVDGKGCCVACMINCHKGHSLVPQPIGPFFCDCPDSNKCKLVIKSKSLPPQNTTLPTIVTGEKCFESYPCQHYVTVKFPSGRDINYGMLNALDINKLYIGFGYKTEQIPKHFSTQASELNTISIPTPVTRTGLGSSSFANGFYY